jgi:hypothetical protein
VADNPSPDLVLAPINGEERTVGQWLTMFHLVVVAVDPFTNESAWLLPTARRILTTYDQADCRVGWLVTGTPDEARRFLGPWAQEMLTFSDPDRTAVKGLGLEWLPAIVHLAMDGTIAGAAEGWDPWAWKAVTDNLSRVTAWSRPLVPAVGDPAPYPGTPALA